MTTTWTNDVQLLGQTNALYDDATILYSQASENYQGQMATVWTDDAKS